MKAVHILLGVAGADHIVQPRKEHSVIVVQQSFQSEPTFS